MKVNYANPTGFESRKININQAREICSLMQQQCSYPSYWKQERIDFYKIIRETQNIDLRYKKLSALAVEMSAIGKRLVKLRDFYLKYAKEPFKYFSKLIEGVKKFQTLNCGEAARLTYMVCRMNDIAEEDTKVVDIKLLVNGNNEEMDHAITKIKSDSGILGIDALLGETNSLGNLAKIYRSKYSDEFHIPQNSVMKFTEEETPKLTNEEAQELAKKYPEFLLKIDV